MEASGGTKLISVSISQPIDGVELFFHRIRVEEKLNTIPEARLEFLGDSDDVTFEKLLGENLTVHFGLPDGQERRFDGVACEVSYLGRRGRYAHYRCVLRTWPWLLSLNSDCRIFQDKSVIDIVEEVCEERGFTDLDIKLRRGDYKPLHYSVQFNESDQNYIWRLCEDAGICCYYRYETGKHFLCLADKNSEYVAAPGAENLTFNADMIDRGYGHRFVTEWRSSGQLRPGRRAYRDYDFEGPNKNLECKREYAAPGGDGAQLAKKMAQWEVYTFPGNYTEQGVGEDCVRLRLEEQQTWQTWVHGSGGTLGLAPGHTFTIEGLPRSADNKEYLVVATEFDVEGGPPESTEQGDLSYICRFTALDHNARPYTPERITQVPVIPGPQTATVEGDGQISTDNHGRVRVRFPWQRDDRAPADNKCWLRVSHNWAGSGNRGGLFLPEVGDEVLVSFIQGNVNDPVITGRVYNGNNMPTEALPAAMTRNGWRDAQNNFFFMDEKSGSELVDLHGTKDMQSLVDNDKREKVGNDRFREVVANEQIGIGKNWTGTIGDNRSIDVGQQEDRVIGADQNNTIKANQNNSVIVNKKTDIGGNFDEAVTGNFTQNITGNTTKSITQNETKTVTMNATKNVVMAAAFTVGAGYAETVNMGKVQNITGGKTVTVTGDSSESATGNKTESYKGNSSIAVTGGRTVVGGQGPGRDHQGRSHRDGDQGLRPQGQERHRSPPKSN